MSNTTRVLELLAHELPKVLSKYTDINQGGCGHVAKIIAEQLDLRQISYEIACENNFRGCVSNDQVNHDIETRNLGGLPNSHVLIKVAGRYFDSDGEEVYSSGVADFTLIDHTTLSLMLKVKGAWSKCFDGRQLRGMRKKVKDVFDKTDWEVFEEVEV